MSDRAQPERLMTNAEVADYLQLAPATLHNMRSARTGPPAYRVGNRLRYRKSLVDAWLEQQASGAA